MKTVVVVSAIVAVMFALAWAIIMPETHSWRQKLTLVVETPGGEVTGSSVVEVRVDYYSGGQIMSGTEVHYDLTGEAAVVEVLPGRYLFALMGDSEELFFRAAKDQFKGMTRGEWLREMPGQTELVTLTDDLIPMLVTFDDITKPETVQLVEPTGLTAVFGEGVRLKAVTLEITREAVTEGRVEGALRWLCSYTNPHRRLSGKSGAIFDNELSNRLGPVSFSTGGCK
ncbi:hypothetical protein [Tabrizicola sp.]|uniref:hypothetical protein n=1 Tax=Tabrizicola sp. TaxID=2005166 RepID=UPI001A645C16|nr:hypothetical protein [Tabrizicola sp.]MBL9064603.1 hypothetical protein [Tabrizicola sp.]